MRIRAVAIGIAIPLVLCLSSFAVMPSPQIGKTLPKKQSNALPAFIKNAESGRGLSSLIFTEKLQKEIAATNLKTSPGGVYYYPVCPPGFIACSLTIGRFSCEPDWIGCK